MEEVKRDFSDIVLEPQLQVGGWVGWWVHWGWDRWRSVLCWLEGRGLSAIVLEPQLQVGPLRLCIVDFCHGPAFTFTNPPSHASSSPPCCRTTCGRWRR